MQTFKITIDNTENAQFFLKLIKKLSFVNSVRLLNKNK